MGGSFSVFVLVERRTEEIPMESGGKSNVWRENATPTIESEVEMNRQIAGATEHVVGKISVLPSI
jgi:hypothetical protein